MTAIGNGNTSRTLTHDEIRRVCMEGADALQADGKKLLFVIPDLSRTCRMDLMFKNLYEALADRAASIDFLIALGTHPPLTKAQMFERVGITEAEYTANYSKARFYNHQWDDPDALDQIGELTAGDIHELTGGLFEMSVAVTVNKMIHDYDKLVIIGPVFPHEVVGFSGGNKYIFPGICGPELLNFFHWLGAVITNPQIIGNKWTPVRRVLDKAASFVPVERKAFCMVVAGTETAGVFFGDVEDAWSSAADLSREWHIHYTDQAYHTVLSCAPKMYDELWTGAKCMYKLEPTVADGGRLIIYAPHIEEISITHGEKIRSIGYHVRDYFLKQWDKFKDVPWGVLAHSTHVKGIGTYEDGIETPRVNVILATKIPEAECRKVNLGYMDYREINVEDYMNREEEGILHVPKAGEMLYRWKDAPPELGGSAT